MKKLSLLITFVMLFSCIGISAIAEETANPVKTIYIIPAEGEQSWVMWGTTIPEARPEVQRPK